MNVGGCELISTTIFSLQKQNIYNNPPPNKQSMFELIAQIMISRKVSNFSTSYLQMCAQENMVINANNPLSTLQTHGAFRLSLKTLEIEKIPINAAKLHNFTSKSNL